MRAPHTPSVQAQLVKICATILATAALLVGLAAFVLLYAANPLYDEWSCSPGQYPVSFSDGGSTCIPNGETPPPGATPDPAGNRPL